MTTRSSYALSLFASIFFHAALAALLILFLGSGHPIMHRDAAPQERSITFSVRFTVGSESKPRRTAQRTPDAGGPVATAPRQSAPPPAMPAARSALSSTASSMGSTLTALPPVQPALSPVTSPAQTASPARSPSRPQGTKLPDALPVRSKEAARPAAPAGAALSSTVSARSARGGTAAAPPVAVGPPSGGAGRSEVAGEGPVGPSPSFCPVRLLAPLRVSYPLVARRRGWQGLVLIRLSVEENGSVGTAEIERSSGHRALDEAALQAALQGSFAAARRGVTPVASTILLPVRFHLGSVTRQAATQAGPALSDGGGG